MFQAKVLFHVTGTTMQQDWETWERAASSLVGLLRVSGYSHTPTQIRAELKNGGEIEYGSRRYWIEEPAQ